LSRGICIVDHAKSNSIKLCAHLLDINSKPELKKIEYYNEHENTLNIKPTQRLLSQLIQKEKDVSDPKQVFESNYRVLALRNLVHRVVLILYSISISFAMPHHSLASTRLARRRPKVLQVLEILES
jgi:hypothetical protein